MKVFPAGSSPDAMLDWIVEHGLLLLPYHQYPSTCVNQQDAIADWEVTIQGTIVDTLSRPVRGATVIITDASGVALSGQTDNSGVYRIKGPWLNNNLLKVASNPIGYTNGPFTASFSISATNHSTVIASALAPVPIRAA